MADRIENNLPAESDAAYLRALDNSGNPIRISKADLSRLMAGLMPENALLSKLDDGVFIMFHRNSDNYPQAVKPHEWASYQSSGEIAEGVLVVEGGKMLVVAPTEATLTWSSAAVSAGGKTTTDRLTAMDDWTGKTSTATQITHSECNTESYAPGFCASYARVNANGNGLTAGRWWLPSLGEMMMIYANMTKVNYALSLISGATQLVGSAYWTSTESSATGAWFLSLFNGTVSLDIKTSKQNCVRAVSAFIS